MNAFAFPSKMIIVLLIENFCFAAFALQFLQQEALKEDMLKPVPEKSLKHIISSYEAILPTAKALLSRTQNIQLRNTLSEVLDASEIIYGKLKSGSPADIAELKEYLSEKRSTVAGNLGRLILATVNVLGDLSTNKHAISLYGA